MQLVKTEGKVETPAIALRNTPAQVGRGIENDLVLDDPTVSAVHASVWCESGRGWIRDLSSRNGTWVNEERIRVAPLADGDKVRIGSVEFVVRGAVEAPQPVDARLRAWMLEDVDAGLRYPFRGGKLVVGPDVNADVQVPMAAEEEVSLVVHADGEIWRSTLEEDGPVPLDDVLVIGGRRFRIVEATGDAATRTRDLAPRGVDYRLEVTLQGPTGPAALLIDRGTGRRHEVSAHNRAVLLWILAKARAESDPRDADAGWCSDDEVNVGIWGRRGSLDPNGLHVLVHRLRAELKNAGFEPWFIEKRKRAIRIVIRDVVVR